MKIYQTFYEDAHKKFLIDGITSLDTRGMHIPRLEYDIFKQLRSVGDFGVISWKFKTKCVITSTWMERVQDVLSHHRAVIINPFMGIEAVSHNCWDTHPSLKPIASKIVDCSVYMNDMAFCSYIFAKKDWWDNYFDFIDKKLDCLPTTLLEKSAGYVRNHDLNMYPFIIERLLNYCFEEAYLWKYDKENYITKFGDEALYNLKQLKAQPMLWKKEAVKYNIWEVARIDEGII